MYNVQLLKTRPDCEAQIVLVNAEKKALELEKINLESDYESTSLSSADIESKLAALDAQLQALQVLHDDSPDGPSKKEMALNIRKLDNRKFSMQLRRESQGVFAVLQQEREIANIDFKIEDIDSYIVQVTARMEEIR